MRLIGNAHATVFESTFEDNINTGVVITISSSAIFFESIFQDNTTGFGIQVSQGSSAGFISGDTENISQRNGIGVGVEQVSAFQMGGAIVIDNTSDGVLVTHGSFVTMDNVPSTIEGNGTDVVCRFRGGLRVFTSQVNTGTPTTFISADCLVDGAIF